MVRVSIRKRSDEFDAPRPQRREAPADVIGNAVHVMRIATGEIEEDRGSAVESVFGDDVDYAQLVKLYGAATSSGP